MSRQELCRAIAAGLVFSALSYAGAAAEDVQINETMNNLYIADHHTHQYVGNNVIIAPRDHTQTAVKLDYESLVELKADSHIRINGHTGIKADHTDIALQAGANTDITAVSTDRDSAYGIYNTVGLFPPCCWQQYDYSERLGPLTGHWHIFRRHWQYGELDGRHIPAGIRGKQDYGRYHRHRIRHGQYDYFVWKP